MFNMINETTKLETRCPFCGKTAIITVATSDFIAWQGGMLIQNAFPYLSDNERESLISGICQKNLTMILLILTWKSVLILTWVVMIGMNNHPNFARAQFVNPQSIRLKIVDF